MHIITSTDILLPRAEDMSAWSVIACDQFTAEPDYWAAAEKLAAEKPSTLSLMLPEAWLHTARAEGADRRIADTMRRYLAEGVFQTIPDSFIYVERILPDGRVRRGLVAALDLEQYDFTGTQHASVRSTEGTVEERLPPRVRIRRGAPLEMPHTLLLMDDRTDSVLSLAEKAKTTLEKVYDFDLMLGGGHITGSATATTLLPRPNGSGRKNAKRFPQTNGRPIRRASLLWRSRTSTSRRSILSRSTACSLIPIRPTLPAVSPRTGRSGKQRTKRSASASRRRRASAAPILPGMGGRSTISTATTRRALSAKSRTAPQCCCRRWKRTGCSCPFSKTALCRKRAFPWAMRAISAIILNAGKSFKKTPRGYRQ